MEEKRDIASLKKERSVLIQMLSLALVLGAGALVGWFFLVRKFPNNLWILGMILGIIGVLLIVVAFTGIIPTLNKTLRMIKGKNESDTKIRKGPPKWLGILIAVLLIGGMVALAVTVIFAEKTFDETEKDDYGNTTADVWSAAKDTVSSKLKAPSTAKFCTRSEATIERSNNRWTVSGWVDAQNSFGATIRNDFTVVIVYSGHGSYTINSCSIN